MTRWASAFSTWDIWPNRLWPIARRSRSTVGRASTWYNLGTSVSDLGEISQAVKAYRRALALDPNHESAAYNLSRALLLLGEWD
jgi:tetratricopeptide (TPR) repeat protein